jgi:hypothetical protein
MEHLNIRSGRLPPGQWATLMVTVNMLLLSFFMILTALSAAQQDRLIQGVAVLQAKPEPAEVAVQQPNDADNGVQIGGVIPHMPATSWSEKMAKQLQGVVINRLKLNSIPMEADASRVILTLPYNQIFTKDRLVNQELIRALTLATQGSQTVWELTLPSPELASQGAQVAALTGQVNLRSTLTAQKVLKLVVRPGLQTPPSIGYQLEQLGGNQGVTVTGKAAP